MRDELPHSAEYFGEQRDYWWNGAFVEFMLRRWGLTECRAMLDVGCGVGHWGRTLIPHLPEDATLTGIDLETDWVATAAARALRDGLEHRTNYVKGSALALPFEEGSFDLVTCQTLLIHIEEPREVLAEMLRVLRPGGRVLVCEPNNMANSQVVSSARFDEPIATRVSLMKFQLICERGKAVLGLGNNSVGDLVPGMFAKLGLEAIDVCLSDRATAMIPPYSSRDQIALRDQLLEWSDRGFWIWSKRETREYYTAGGGTDEEFAVLWDLAIATQRREAQTLERGDYTCGGGSVSYLVVGRKPRA